MEHVIQTLKRTFWLIVGLLILLALTIEYVLIDISGGCMLNNKSFEFVYQTLMILFTLGFIFCALRLFKISGVRHRIKENPLASYTAWSMVRLSMLAVPLLLNMIGYWLFVNSSFVWLAVILALAFPFVYPGKTRFIQETEIGEL